MPPTQLAPSAPPLSGRYLSFAERELLALLRAERHGVRECARRLGRDPSTISRELRRNAATRSGAFEISPMIPRCVSVTKRSIKPSTSRAWRAAPGTHRLPTDGARAARPARTHSRDRQGIRDAGGDDQRASRGSRRPRGPGALGGRYHLGPGQFGYRHARRAHDPLHTPAAPTPHARACDRCPHDRRRRTVRRSRGTAPRLCATRSRARSGACRHSCGAR